MAKRSDITTDPVSREVASFISAHAPEVRDLTLAARSFVLRMIPDVSEQVDVKARIIGYGYGPKYADMVCMLMPTKAGVNLGIAYAMELPDPDGLLEGTGRLHRHVKLRSKADLEDAALKSLMRAAIARQQLRAQKQKK
ncbi:MAG TPA: DUF1801 domain-containing protein [Candidatus Binatia bacterium]|nr:DUF1801 domain-containing protein [Candidatus Binatia bacterium]